MCLSPKPPKIEQPTPVAPPKPLAPLQPAAPTDADPIKAAAQARKKLRIDLAPGGAGAGLKIPVA